MPAGRDAGCTRAAGIKLFVFAGNQAAGRELRARARGIQTPCASAPPEGPDAFSFGSISAASWLKPGLIARVRYLKGEAKLRHATVREVEEL